MWRERLGIRTFIHWALFRQNRTRVLISDGSQRRRGAAACRSRSPRGRSADPGGGGHVGEGWAARLVGERTAGMVGSGYEARTAGNGGSEPLIFVPVTAHSHDLFDLHSLEAQSVRNADHRLGTSCVD